MTHHKYRFAHNRTAWPIGAAIVARRRRSFIFARSPVQLNRCSSRPRPARPQDAERLAALDHWAALYASDGSSPDQVAAAMMSARAAREISSIRSHRAAILASIDTAHPSDKARRTLSGLTSRKRLWQASQQSALDYLEQTASDG